MLAMELSESKVCALLMVRGMQSMPAGTGHCCGWSVMGRLHEAQGTVGTKPNDSPRAVIFFSWRAFTKSSFRAG